MARMATKINLTEKQEKILRLLSNGRTVPIHHQQRATILLHCAAGKTNLEIEGALDLDKTTVSRWRTRWAANQERLSEIEKEEQGIEYQRAIEQVLSDAPRPGAPAKFNAEQICLIISVACESPESSDLPLSHWSLPSLADELVKREIVASISTSQWQVFLKSGRYQAPQSKTVDSHAH